MKYPADNLITENVYQDDLDIIDEFTKANNLAPSWHDFRTYDMVQCGYPVPDHGEMIGRAFGGTDADGKLLPGDGMWVKLEDVLNYIEKLKNDKRST